jgi:transcriptional regulator with XRE-family HTH domain
MEAITMTTRLEKWRKSRFYSVRGLAAKANVKPNTISDIENGKTKYPKRSTMERLAEALGVPLEDLAEEVPEPRHSAA